MTKPCECMWPDIDVAAIQKKAIDDSFLRFAKLPYMEAGVFEDAEARRLYHETFDLRCRLLKKRMADGMSVADVVEMLRERNAALRRELGET